MILTKQSKQALLFRLGGDEIDLQIDVYGRLHYENITEHDEDVLEFLLYRSSALLLNLQLCHSKVHEKAFP